MLPSVTPLKVVAFAVGAALVATAGVELPSMDAFDAILGAVGGALILYSGLKKTETAPK